ncbi:MAG: CPBP family intramembrane metalloprotease [Proteobacteria bacterium]|nr:CPBP family intramembrane metalloprotease [Pseudomonadota bacterium]
MEINWPLIIVLFSLSIPGIVITIPRLIHFLLKQNSQELQKRISTMATIQTLLMAFIMCFAGTIIATKTGLRASPLDSLIQGQPVFAEIQEFILPLILYTLLAIVIFCLLYYGIGSSFLDEKTITTMTEMRAAIKADGCILYNGMTEEIFARFGLMNLIAFFSILFYGQKTMAIFWMSAFLSGLLYGASQLPAYIAAGCVSSRRFIYIILLIYTSQALIFGWLYWQYGLVAAIISHMLFHIFWYIYHKV